MRPRGYAMVAICWASFVGCGTASPDRVLVTSGATDEVLELDGANGNVLSQVPLDPRFSETDEPHGIAVSPRGTHWFATVSHGEPTLWKFELPDNRLVGRVSLGISGASRIGISPDGETAIIPDYYRGGRGAPSQVAVVRLHDLQVLDRPTVCAAPHDAQYTHDGSVIAVACSHADEVVLLDAVTFTEVGRFAVDPIPGPPGSPRFRPLNLLWGPRDETLLVTLHDADLVRVFTRAGDIVADVPTGAGPAQLAVLPAAGWLVSANRRDGSISIIAMTDWSERARVALGVAHPHGVAAARGADVVYVTYEGDTESPGGVVAVSIPGANVLWRTVGGAYTLGVAVAPGN